ncbi:MAG: hypothetical protein WBA67_07315 [Jannaschia sp.]
MAQPHDIEDVLSSIRRLVANDTAASPPRTREAESRSLAIVEETPDDRPEALVLAPAQRVIDPDDPFQMIRALAQEERDGRDAEFFLDGMEDAMDGVIADLESEDPISEDWDSRPNEAGDAVDVPADYLEDTDYQADIAADATPDLAEQAEAASARTVEDLAPEPEAVVSAEGTREEDAPATGGADQGGSTASRAPTDLADLSEAVSRDDALRDLISEIVRQELSGALGERITRNVRKLVRREIRQMLSSGEFD